MTSLVAVLGALTLMAHLAGEEIAFWIFGTAAGLVALHQIRKHLFSPAWELVQVVVDGTRAHPVLMNIAKEFAPNDGKTLHDRVTGIEDALAHERREREDIQKDVKEVRNMMRTYIADRLPGGHRRSDPCDPQKEDSSP